MHALALVQRCKTPVCSICINMCLMRSHHIICTQPRSRLAFALQLSELDESLERLDIRCNRFMKGAKRYKEGINTLSQSQHSFADFLEEFCGGTDEESMILGNKLFEMHFASAGMLPVHPCKVLQVPHITVLSLFLLGCHQHPYIRVLPLCCLEPALHQIP